MKKILFIATLLAIAVLMGACKKDGVFNPDEKISAIYCYYSHYYQEYDSLSHLWVAMDSTVYPKSIREKWNWEGKTLQSIEYYQPSYGKATASSTMSFEYDGKRLTRATETKSGAPKVTIDFEYDGRRIESMKVYLDGNLSETYSFDFDGKKLHKLTITPSGNGKQYAGWQNGSLLDNSIWQSIIPGFSETAGMQQATSDKAQTANGSVTTYEYTWNGKNISKITARCGDATETRTFTYDKKNNPIQRFFALTCPDMSQVSANSDISLTSQNLEGANPAVDLCSKNNITSVKEGQNTTYFSYTYGDNWPITRTQQKTDKGNRSRNVDTEIMYYEY